MTEEYINGLKEASKEFFDNDIYDDKLDLETKIEIDNEGRKNLAVIYNEKLLFLNSRYDSKRFIELWCNQQDISNYKTVVVVFGIGDGQYVKWLRKKNKEMLIIVYEPSHSICNTVRENFDIDEICEDENLIIVVGKSNHKGLFQLIGTVISYENRKYVKYYISPNYEIIFADEIEFVRRIIEERCQTTCFYRNTSIVLKDEINRNITKNLLDCIEQSTLSKLVEQFKTVDISKTPAILVAAGPSLDKNINELKNAKGKAFIIAVDTALNALAKAEIIPDIAITVDPHKPIQLFTNEKSANVPLIYHLSGNYEILSVHKGKRIYQESTDSILNKYYVKYGIISQCLETGGSVANDAFSLAQMLGFKTIIFVGLDLAYPNDKAHSENSYGEEYRNVISDNGKVYFYVDDIYGGKVKTEHNMNMYRKWFERCILVYSDIRYIDATEGGAKKEGMEIMTLKEAIKDTCSDCSNIDFSEIINGIEPTFSTEERKEIIEDIANFENNLKELRKKIRNGISLYNRLDEYNRKHNYSDIGFLNTYEKIKEINEWLTDDDETKYLAMYNADKDFEIRDAIFEEKEDIYQELNYVIGCGKEMLNSMLKSTDTIYDDMKENIEIAKKIINNIN